MMQQKLDKLTGLYDKEGIESKIHSSFMECVERFDIKDEKNKHYSIVMFDIDYFKAINDLLGHAQGDTVLRELGNVIHDYQEIKKDFIGIFGRYGGEEFLLALPYHTSRQAKYIADQIRGIVQDFAFSDTKRRTDSLSDFITVSMGVGSLDIGDVVKEYLVGDKNMTVKDTIDKLKQEADCALGYAKFLGRNRVELFGKYLLSEMKNLNLVRQFFFKYAHKKFSEIGLFKKDIFSDNPDLKKRAKKYFYVIRTEINPRDTRTQAVFADNFYRFLYDKKSQTIKNKLMQLLRKEI